MRTKKHTPSHSDMSMTTRQVQFLKTRIHWAAGRFPEGELEALTNLAERAGGNMDYLTIRDLFDNLTSLETDALRMTDLEREVKISHVRYILRTHGYECSFCKKIGYYMGSFCAPCETHMLGGHRSHEALEAGYPDEADESLERVNTV